MYFLITCSNGYCGCNEDYIGIFESDLDAYDAAEDILFNYYSFAEPDNRFLNIDVDEDDEDYDEAYEEAYEVYREDLFVEVTPISEEEFDEFKAMGYTLVD